MSWSVTETGKARAVKTKVLDELDRIKCVEPEEAIKAKIADVIAACLEAYPDDFAVKVTAHGSQVSAGADGKVANSLGLSIEPIWGFLEA